MDDNQAAIRDLERMLEAADELVSALRHAQDRYRRTLDALEQGMSVELALEHGQSADTRKAMTTALDEFEKQRHTSRLSLIAAAAKQGSSINSIGKSWGISRQLASRYVSQLRATGAAE
jgi:DNA-binding NarL/FixJ family response regulator